MVRTLQIPSCPDYFADEDGNIFRNGEIIKPQDNGHGYKRIKVSLSGKATDKYVHRLVCEAFHGPPSGGQHARHKNGRRADNRPQNLDWGSKAENEADKRFHGTVVRGEDATNSILTEAIVTQARARAASGERYDQIADSLGFNQRLIASAIRGDRWAHVPGALPPCQSRRRFTPEQVRAIRALKGVKPETQIAVEFGVSRNSIWQILSRKSYGHIA